MKKFKMLISLLSVFAMLCSAFTLTAFAAEDEWGDNVIAYHYDVAFDKGDVTADGNVDIIDLVRFKKYFADTENVEIEADAADINADSDINSQDLVLLKQILIGAYTA